MSRKGFAPIFIIVIVALAAVLGGWYYVKKSSVPVPQPVVTNATSTSEGSAHSTSSGQSAVPADWKTYRNEKYGFEVKYPAVWKLSKNPGSVSLISPEREKNRGGEGSDIPSGDVYISVTPNQNKQDLKTFTNTIEDGWYTSYQIVTPKIIDGRSALSFSDVGYKVPIETIFIQGSSFFVGFSLSDRGVATFNIPDQSKIFNQILSTFKFIQ